MKYYGVILTDDSKIIMKRHLLWDIPYCIVGNSSEKTNGIEQCTNFHCEKIKYSQMLPKHVSTDTLWKYIYTSSAVSNEKYLSIRKEMPISGKFRLTNEIWENMYSQPTF